MARRLNTKTEALKCLDDIQCHSCSGWGGVLAHRHMAVYVRSLALDRNHENHDETSMHIQWTKTRTGNMCGGKGEPSRREGGRGMKNGYAHMVYKDVPMNSR